MQALLNLLAMVAMGTGVLCFAASARHARGAALGRQVVTRRWQRVEAKVLDARIDEIEAAGGAAGVPRYHPRVRYYFRLGESRYEGSRILLNGCGDFTERDAAERWLFNHSPGRLVTAWYDPRCPASCALLINQEPPQRLRSGWLAGGALLIAAGAGALLL